MEEDTNINKFCQIFKYWYITLKSIQKTGSSFSIKIELDYSNLKINAKHFLSYLPKGGTYRRLEIYLSYKRQNTNNNIIKFYPKKNMNSIINSLKLKIGKISNTNNKSRDFNDDP